MMYQGIALVRRCSRILWALAMAIPLGCAPSVSIESPGDPHAALWSRAFEMAEEKDLAVDSEGNIIATGSFSYPVDFGYGYQDPGIDSPDAFVVKLDAEGKTQWSRQFVAAEQQSWVVGTGITVDPSDNVFITGVVSGPTNFGGGVVDPPPGSGDARLFVVKLAPDGAHIWSKMLGPVDWFGDVRIVADTAGSVILTGKFAGTTDLGGGPMASSEDGQDDMFLLKLDRDGNYVWSKQFGGNLLQSGQWVSVDANDNILVHAHGNLDFGEGPPLDRENFLAKFDSSGNLLWSRMMPHVKELTLCNAANAHGDIAIGGGFKDSVDFGLGAMTSQGERDVFITKYDELGAPLWSRSFGTTADENAHFAAIDTEGKVAAVGLYEGRLNFGLGPLPYAGYPRVWFLAKFDGMGAPIWNTNFPQLEGAFTRVSFDHSNNIVVMGNAQYTLDLGDRSTEMIGEGMFIAKFAP